MELRYARWMRRAGALMLISEAGLLWAKLKSKQGEWVAMLSGRGNGPRRVSVLVSSSAQRRRTSFRIPLFCLKQVPTQKIC